MSSRSAENCSHCGSDDVIRDAPDLPYPLCEQCFAYVGMMRVRPVTFWEHFWGALWLFLRIVWRDFDGPISAKTAWQVAWGVHGGTTTRGVRQYPEKGSAPSSSRATRK